MTDENWKKQIAEWQTASENGDGLAKYNLGICYLEGNCVERDEYLAYDLLTDACALLDPEEQREELGYAYFNLAMTALYLFYFPEVVTHLRNAIKYGYTRAYLHLLDCTSPQNFFHKEVLDETRKKYPQGAMALEGLAYLYGLRGYKVDEEKAIALLTEAAYQGESYAADELLQHLLKKDGYPRIEQIEPIIAHASDTWAAHAYTAVGVLLCTPMVKTPNLEKGLEWLGLAMNKYHHAPAALQILPIFENFVRQGMEPDEEFIKSCLNLINEHPELLDHLEYIAAVLIMAEIYTVGKYGVQRDAQKALEYYQKAQSLFDVQNSFWNTEAGKQQLNTMNKERKDFLLTDLRQCQAVIKKGIKTTSKLLKHEK